MTQGNATLILDLGNSETRGTVMFGKDSQTGKYHERDFIISNRFADIDENFKPSNDYNEATSTILRLDAEVNNNRVSGTFVNGDLQEDSFNVAPLRPTSIEKKYNSTTSALSFELAMLYATRAIMSMTRTSNIASLDITWSVVALLPPEDVDAGRDKLVEIFRSIKKVDYIYPELCFDIKLDRVSVLPECFCAYIGTIYEKGHTIRKEYEHILKETTLVIDIGAGTSDIMIIKDGTIVQVTMHTITKGGNNVTQLVKKYIRTEHVGLVLSETDIINGIVSGEIKDGSRVVNIVDYVNKAKEEVAKYLISDIQAFFEECEFMVRSIGKLLIVGGGSVTGDDSSKTNPEIKALSESIVNYMKRLSPYVELIDIPTHMVVKDDENGVSKKVEEKISPRLLNVIGASILAEVI